MSTHSVGQRVLLHGLAARPALNGCVATVVEPSAAEAAELAEKRRVKVRTALADEVLSVRLASVRMGRAGVTPKIVQPN